jgi:hypothetical protein
MRIRVDPVCACIVPNGALNYTGLLRAVELRGMRAKVMPQLSVGEVREVNSVGANIDNRFGESARLQRDCQV